MARRKLAGRLRTHNRGGRHGGHSHTTQARVPRAHKSRH